MGKKQMLFKTKGMNRDLSVSAFNPEFSFENRNLRLSSNEGNTLMSWVTEKGTKRLMLVANDINVTDSLTGYPIGTAVINHQLIVFTTDNNSHSANYSTQTDNIYKLEYRDDNSLNYKLLYSGKLNFSTGYPIETLVSYESEDVQKVYWTDGRNQPRVINVVGKIKKGNDAQFDFLPAYGSGYIGADKTSGGGMFAPGVIQYCFSYYNKHGQQSNIVGVTPLLYIRHTDRGASPEETVNTSFAINFEGVNKGFDYIRLYSIQRTSVNSTPIVKIVVDLATSSAVGGKISYTDNGTTGATIDPTELLFIGGREIKALTMTEKDGTLFLGNITEKNLSVANIQSYFNTNKDTTYITVNEVSVKHIQRGFTRDSSKKNVSLGESTDLYPNISSNDQELNTTFKYGDKYRFGIQLQSETGEWTEPIYIDDVENDKYPKYVSTDGCQQLAYGKVTFSNDFLSASGMRSYKKARPVIVYPSINDRQVLCQGVLNPTVFNALDRIDNSPFAQASWYFRPRYNALQAGLNTTTNGSNNGIKANYGSVSKKEFGSSQTINGQSTTFTANDVDLTVDADYEYNVTGVYVLTATINSTAITNILSRGYFSVRKKTKGGFGIAENTIGGSRSEDLLTTSINMANFSFIGVINLGDNRYAFIRKDPWGTAYGSDQNYKAAEGSLIFETAVTNAYTPSNSFPFYTGMLVDKNRKYYFLKPSGANSSYIFKFYDDTTYYEVTYAVGDESNTDDEQSYDIVTAPSDNGSFVEYKHFEPLFSTDNLTGDNNTKAACQIEIQGSKNIFSSVTATEVSNLGGNRANPTKSRVMRNLTSNTEFFVDQSIVTLNSPDIDFDTEVQNYSMEDLQLAIVGYIPITSSMSAHHITTSSSKLENGHNLDMDIADNLKQTGFGTGELSTNVRIVGDSSNGGKRLVSDYIWNDVLVGKSTKEDKIKTSYRLHDFLVYPWQRTGSLNNDFRTADKASSLLKTKKESNILYSNYSIYFNDDANCKYSEISAQMHLTENDEVMNYRLKQGKDINYYANIDKVLYNEAGYEPIIMGINDNDIDIKETALTSPISMKYKSTSHAVIALKPEDIGGTTKIRIMPNMEGTSSDGTHKYFWEANSSNPYVYVDPTKTVANIPVSYLWLGELRKTPTNLFGGTTREAIRNNKWQIAGSAQPIINGRTLVLDYTIGDTYHQRYDCLKTYAFTPEDTNQIVEILSFMCETHVNLDGRYDRNRGQVDNTNMSPRNFNLLNPVYSQQDNFFTYRRTDAEGIGEINYPNQIAYTKTKNSGADVDLWTNITLANVLELDGSKGKLNKLTRLNDQLLAFQDIGISQILYNENTAISSTEGVPIEIANSGKVTGKRYISDTIGCSNKWAMTTTPNGIYFIDSHDKGIYLFNGQLNNLSNTYGFNSWCKQNITGNGWTPDEFGDFMAVYDKQNQDVLFINHDDCLAFSEKIGVFTSFYDYNNTSYLCNLDGTGIWIKNTDYDTALYQHNGGTYCSFFDTHKDYWMTLVGNPEPQRDKVFTNLEFRACIEGEGNTVTSGNNITYTPYLPFNSLECWNEYQHGITQLKNLNGHSAMMHHVGTDSALKRKFRIWRCDIPRDNVAIPSTTDSDYAAFVEDETAKGIFRNAVHPNDRMRNPWLYLKLKGKQEASGSIVTHGIPTLYGTIKDDHITNYYVVYCDFENPRFFKDADAIYTVRAILKPGYRGKVAVRPYKYSRLIDNITGSGIFGNDTVNVQLPYTFTQEERETIDNTIMDSNYDLAFRVIEENGTVSLDGIDSIAIEKILLVTENVYPKVEIHDITMDYFE